MFYNDRDSRDRRPSNSRLTLRNLRVENSCRLVFFRLRAHRHRHRVARWAVRRVLFKMRIMPIFDAEIVPSYK